MSSTIIVPNPTKLHPKRTRPTTYEYEYDETTSENDGYDD